MEQEDFSKYNGDGTTLRKAQLRMLDILIEVDKICKKHNLTYWIAGGTLLGAVRHGGFIPWDDDLDINMMRKDYKKLLKILPNELSNHFILQNAQNCKYYPLTFSKVRDKFSIFYESNNPKKLKNQGLFIDIFPVEPILSIKLKNLIDSFYGRAFRATKGYYNDITKMIIGYLIYPISYLAVLLARLLAIVSRSSIYADPYGFQSSRFHELNSILPCRPIQFEGKTVMGPANPEKWLSAHYDNYMQIPPENQRAIHSEKITFLD